MGKRIFLQRKGSTMDSVLMCVGFIVSILYVCIILAIIFTLVVGSWKSIQRFSFSFLVGTQWNVRAAVARTPDIDIHTGRRGDFRADGGSEVDERDGCFLRLRYLQARF